jgi:UrcA family protein
MQQDEPDLSAASFEGFDLPAPSPKGLFRPKMKYWKEYMMATPLKIIAPAAALMALAISFPATASDTTIAVQHADLDLTKASGQDTLKKRVDAAVSRICRIHGKVSLQESMAARKCTADLTARTARDVRVTIARVGNKSRVANALSPIVAGN